MSSFNIHETLLNDKGHNKGFGLVLSCLDNSGKIKDEINYPENQTAVYLSYSYNSGENSICIDIPNGSQDYKDCFKKLEGKTIDSIILCLKVSFGLFLSRILFFLCFIVLKLCIKLVLGT